MRAEGILPTVPVYFRQRQDLEVPDVGEELITTEEAAKMLLVADKTLKDWLRAGKFPGVKAGGRWRVRRGDVQALIEGRLTVAPKQQAEPGGADGKPEE